MDPTQLEWSDDERRELARDEHTRRFTEMLPGGVHVRPVDLAYGDELYLIWTYETDARPYVWPPTFDPHYGDVVLRGCARMMPGLAAYVGHGRDGRRRRRLLLQDAREPSARSARCRSTGRTCSARCPASA